jgi:DNA-binding NarL/FixJ family response regulator
MWQNDPSPVRRGGSSMRVLVVDDQESGRDAARAVVDKAHGFMLVGEARSGHEALRLCASAEPDIVLLDVRMPEMDGFETARRIQSRHPDVVIVLLSTYVSDSGVIAKDALSTELLEAAADAMSCSGLPTRPG